MKTNSPSHCRSGLKLCLAMLCAAMMAPSAAHAVSLAIHRPGNATDFTPDSHTFSSAGSFFDLTAIDDIQLTGISAFAVAEGPYEFDVYFRSGTTVGNELDSTGWTLLETFTGIDSTFAAPELLAFTTPFGIAAGQTVGFAVASNSSGLRWYDTAAPETYTDGTITVEVPDGTSPGPAEAKGFDTLFSDTNSLRSFAGSVHYSAVPEPTRALLSLVGIAAIGLRRRRS